MTAYYIRTQRLNTYVGDDGDPMLFMTRREARAAADRLSVKTPSKYGRLIVSEWQETSMYMSQAARDAQRANYGSARYWQSLDDAAQRHHDYYSERGDNVTAAAMFTRTLGEALQGNDGD